MNDLKREIFNNSKSSEKEKLELEAKRVDIQKKRSEIRKENLEIDELLILRNIDSKEQSAELDKILVLGYLLSDCIIDSGRCTLGNEFYFAPTIEGERREILLNKLMKLINKL